jgi:hypothetical protein
MDGVARREFVGSTQQNLDFHDGADEDS